MTGPEHYQAAERAIAQVASAGGEPAVQQRFLALAQIHASLASTAATALAAVNSTYNSGPNRFYQVSSEDREAWATALAPTA